MNNKDKNYKPRQAAAAEPAYNEVCSRDLCAPWQQVSFHSSHPLFSKYPVEIHITR